jgi:hypothetical protein
VSVYTVYINEMIMIMADLLSLFQSLTCLTCSLGISKSSRGVAKGCRTASYTPATRRVNAIAAFTLVDSLPLYNQVRELFLYCIQHFVGSCNLFNCHLCQCTRSSLHLFFQIVHGRGASSLLTQGRPSDDYCWHWSLYDVHVTRIRAGTLWRDCKPVSVNTVCG